MHDDAYIINTEDLSSIALEPTYFDKMQDYPVEHPANEFLLTLQNVGVTMDDEGRKVVLAEDVVIIMVVLSNLNSGQRTA